MVLGELLRSLSQPCGVTDIGRSVAQVAGEVHAAASGQAQVECILESLAGAGGEDGNLAQLALGGLLALELGKGIELLFQGSANQAELAGLGGDRVVSVECCVCKGDDRIPGGAILQHIRHGDQGLAVISRLSILVRASANNQYPAPGGVVYWNHQGGAGLASQVAVLVQGLQLPSHGFVCLGGAGRPVAFLGDRHDQAIGSGTAEGFAAEREIHGNSC